jgi:hypothetical protein
MIRSLNKLTKTIRFRTLGLATLSVVPLLLGVTIWEITQENTPPEYYMYLLLSISMLLSTISSFFVIKYKEMPRPGSLPSATGGWAVFWGTFCLLIFGFGFFFALYETAIRIF